MKLKVKNVYKLFYDLFQLLVFILYLVILRIENKIK